MQDSTYRFIRSILGSKIYDPGSSNSREAVALYSGQQLTIYKRILSTVVREANNRKSSDNYYSRLRSAAENIINQGTENSPPEVNIIDHRSILVSAVPIVTDPMAGEARDWLKANGNTDDDIFTAFVAGLMYEFQPLFDIPASEIPSAVLPELSNYAALRAIEIAPLDSREGISRRLNDIATTANTLLDDIKSQTAAASNSIRELSEQLQERAATALQAAETAAKQAGEFGLRTKDLGDRIDSFQVDIEAKTQDAQDKLDSFLDAARARTAYQHIVKYWDDRANASWWALVLSSLVLAVLLVALPAFAVYENDVVVTLLKHLTDATSVPVGTTEPNAVVLTVATVSRLVVITIPLALYFWLIKLVVRFNMRSMLLMDDARQRSTIIETYYKMIEQQAATKEDRAMILQALCRPPPGHGGDSVDPPSLTDVVEKAVGKSVTP